MKKRCQRQRLFCLQGVQGRKADRQVLGVGEVGNFRQAKELTLIHNLRDVRLVQTSLEALLIEDVNLAEGAEDGVQRAELSEIALGCRNLAGVDLVLGRVGRTGGVDNGIKPLHAGIQTLLEVLRFESNHKKILQKNVMSQGSLSLC